MSQAGLGWYPPFFDNQFSVKFIFGSALALRSFSALRRIRERDDSLPAGIAKIEPRQKMNRSPRRIDRLLPVLKLGFWKLLTVNEFAASSVIASGTPKLR